MQKATDNKFVLSMKLKYGTYHLLFLVNNTIWWWVHFAVIEGRAERVYGGGQRGEIKVIEKEQVREHAFVPLFVCALCGCICACALCT